MSASITTGQKRTCPDGGFENEGPAAVRQCITIADNKEVFSVGVNSALWCFNKEMKTLQPRERGKIGFDEIVLNEHFKPCKADSALFDEWKWRVDELGHKGQMKGLPKSLKYSFHITVGKTRDMICTAQLQAYLEKLGNLLETRPAVVGTVSIDYSQLEKDVRESNSDIQMRSMLDIKLLTEERILPLARMTASQRATWLEQQRNKKDCCFVHAKAMLHLPAPKVQEAGFGKAWCELSFVQKRQVLAYIRDAPQRKKEKTTAAKETRKEKAKEAYAAKRRAEQEQKEREAKEAAALKRQEALEDLEMTAMLLEAQEEQEGQEEQEKAAQADTQADAQAAPVLTSIHSPKPVHTLANPQLPTPVQTSSEHGSLSYCESSPDVASEKPANAVAEIQVDSHLDYLFDVEPEEDVAESKDRSQHDYLLDREMERAIQMQRDMLVVFNQMYDSMGNLRK